MTNKELAIRIVFGMFMAEYDGKLDKLQFTWKFNIIQ